MTKTLNVILWILQVVLALLLIWAAAMKLFQQPAKLAEMWPWAGEVPVLLVKFTGLTDLAGGLGLLLPGLLRIRPGLTALAAFGIVTLMVCAIVFHVVRGEGASIGFNIFVALVAAFIGWGRLKKKQ